MREISENVSFRTDNYRDQNHIMKEKKVIVAPLNWGLGHATRCIPLIKALILNGFTPIIASDGAALKLLKKEFPQLEYFKLPSYDIRYGKNLKTSLLLQAPKILKAVKREQKTIEMFVSNHKDIVGIISDNRFGVRSKKIPSVYTTHQLNILSGVFSFLTTYTHSLMIKEFDECWIPDEKESTLSGKLSSVKRFSIPIKYLGILSRLIPEELPVKNDILIILSGPEPNRTSLEKKLLKEFKSHDGKVVLVRGTIDGKQEISYQEKIKVYNYLLSDELEKEINQSEIVVCRSGYSSIMDLSRLGKKAFFIPTKGQKEQEYLAEYLEHQRIVPYSSEEKFKGEMIERVKKYRGFETINSTFNSKLFTLFQG